MPFRSESQRRFMHAKHPGVAARWEKEAKSKVGRARLGAIRRQLRRAKSQE